MSKLFQRRKLSLVAVTLVSARLCVLGTEPDESFGGKVRFVLPPGDPCSCTELMLGGHNSYAPPRKDKPVYIDNLPMDAEGLRRSQGCPEESTRRDSTQTPTSKGKTKRERKNSKRSKSMVFIRVFSEIIDLFEHKNTTPLGASLRANLD